MSKRHEKLLFRYSSALERGDFQVVADVLHEAERDPTLEQMILDMNDAYAAERFNHANPKERPMIAALYQNQKRMPRLRWQGLPFVAALAVIALLTIMLAVQTTRGNNPLNSGYSGGDDPSAAQITPYCTGTLISTFSTVPLYSRPAADAPVVAELRYDNNAGREIVVLDVASVDGETWVFVRVPSSPDVPFGWTTEAQFRTMVAGCQPTLVPVEAAVQQPTLVPPTAIPQVDDYCKTTTRVETDVLSLPSPDGAILGSLSAHTLVSVLDSEVYMAQVDVALWYFVAAQGIQGWVSTYTLESPTCTLNQAETPVPGIVQQPLATFTATPAPLVIEPLPLLPTVVPPAQDGAGAGEQFMPVYVQPGDTLISVLRRFNIDLERIPELMRLNNLTDNSFVTGSAELSPGTLLLVPVPNLGSLLTCTLQAGEQVDVLTEDAEDAEVVMTLQAGDSLDVFTEPIADWYAAVVHYDSATMSSVYVRVGDVEQLADCQPVATADTAVTLVPISVITATPVPFGEQPTALPPLVITATPFPPTVEPPAQALATATPIPTATPVR